MSQSTQKVISEAKVWLFPTILTLSLNSWPVNFM